MILQSEFSLHFPCRVKNTFLTTLMLSFNIKLMQTSQSCGHATHNQDCDLIIKSRKRSGRSVTQWKHVPRHRHFWNEVESRHEVSYSLINQI